jgi:hypothetical protein
MVFPPATKITLAVFENEVVNFMSRIRQRYVERFEGILGAQLHAAESERKSRHRSADEIVGAVRDLLM